MTPKRILNLDRLSAMPFWSANPQNTTRAIRPASHTILSRRRTSERIAAMGLIEGFDRCLTPTRREMARSLGLIAEC